MGFDDSAGLKGHHSNAGRVKNWVRYQWNPRHQLLSAGGEEKQPLDLVDGTSNFEASAEARQDDAFLRTNKEAMKKSLDQALDCHPSDNLSSSPSLSDSDSGSTSSSEISEDSIPPSARDLLPPFSNEETQMSLKKSIRANQENKAPLSRKACDGDSKHSVPKERYSKATGLLQTNAAPKNRDAAKDHHFPNKPGEILSSQPVCGKVAILVERTPLLEKHAEKKPISQGSIIIPASADALASQDHDSPAQVAPDRPSSHTEERVAQKRGSVDASCVKFGVSRTSKNSPELKSRSRTQNDLAALKEDEKSGLKRAFSDGEEREPKRYKGMNLPTRGLVFQGAVTREDPSLANVRARKEFIEASRKVPECASPVPTLNSPSLVKKPGKANVPEQQVVVPENPTKLAVQSREECARSSYKALMKAQFAPMVKTPSSAIELDKFDTLARAVGSDFKELIQNPIFAGLHKLYHSFSKKYPMYSGSERHFLLGCRELMQLHAENKAPEQEYWDDFIIQHKRAYYQDYLSKCVDNFKRDMLCYKDYWNQHIDIMERRSDLVTQKKLTRILRGVKNTEKKNVDLFKGFTHPKPSQKA